ASKRLAIARHFWASSWETFLVDMAILQKRRSCSRPMSLRFRGWFGVGTVRNESNGRGRPEKCQGSESAGSAPGFGPSYNVSAMRKNLETIHNVVIGTAGHIDHGKSTLVEKLTGINPDRLPEEKARGVTIDLGFARFELESGLRVGIVDVPGHERFVKNMVAGA